MLTVASSTEVIHHDGLLVRAVDSDLRLCARNTQCSLSVTGKFHSSESLQVTQTAGHTSGTLPSFDIEAKIPDIDIWTISNTKPSISKVSVLALISGTICNYDIEGLYFDIKVGML